MEENNVRALVSASREVSHAVSNLAAVAALAAASEDDVRIRAMEAGMNTARAAFVLDDIHRRHNGSATTLDAAERALDAAEVALQRARDGVRVLRGRLVAAQITTTEPPAAASHP